MIITKNIEKKVTQYNLRIFKKFGFSIGDIAVVDIITKRTINSKKNSKNEDQFYLFQKS